MAIFLIVINISVVATKCSPVGMDTMLGYKKNLKEGFHYRDRAHAGRVLAESFHVRELTDPLVLALPRGGVPVAEVLSEHLNAELDVVLVRKLRAPRQPELALGAIAENGAVYLDEQVINEFDEQELRIYLQSEIDFQTQEILRRQELVRKVRPRAEVKGRTVIVVDDGIATGSTMIAALQLLRQEEPAQLLVAVPVGSPERLKLVKQYCDDLICPHCSSDFNSIGQYYQDFSPVDDSVVVSILSDTYLKFSQNSNNR